MRMSQWAVQNEGEPPGLVCNEMSANEHEPKSDRAVGSSCNNTTEATLCATSEVRAERVRRHAGVLAQPRSHSLGRRRLYSI